MTTLQVPAEPAVLPGILWDQGGLTKDGASRFAGLAQPVLLTAGPRQELLRSALGQGVVGTTQAGDGTADAARVVALAKEGLGPSPVVFLGVGAPFDAREWCEELERALVGSEISGLVVVVPGPGSGPLTMVPLTDAARSYIPLVQNGIAAALGHKSPGLAGNASGFIEGAAVLENQIGDVVLLYATHQHSDAQKPRPRPKIGAADTVHVIMKDNGLEVTNRTDMPVELRIHLGSPGGEILETLEVFLQPRSAEFFHPEQLGSVGALEPPAAELRQWSHEAEVVYQGGERRIHLVEIHYLQDSSQNQDRQNHQVIGTGRFGSPDAVVSGAVSTEIAKALGEGSHSMGQRMVELATRQGWREALQSLVAPSPH
mgnify:CR=1 FL=1